MNREVVKISSSEGHDFWVDVTFLKRCKNPSMEDTYTLFNLYFMRQFLHNINGPAIISNSGGKTYYLLGEPKSKYSWELETKNIKFSNKLEELINE